MRTIYRDDYIDLYEVFGVKTLDELNEEYDVNYSDEYEAINDYIRDTYELLDMEYPMDENMDIIAIADIGAWDGRKRDYKRISTLGGIFNTSCAYNHYFIKDRNVRSRNVHHNGVNYVLYREFKDHINDEQKERFLYMLSTGTLTKRQLAYYTNSIVKYFD